MNETKCITFSTQEEFETAVMKVLRGRLSVVVCVSKETFYEHEETIVNVGICDGDEVITWDLDQA